MDAASGEPRSRRSSVVHAEMCARDLRPQFRLRQGQDDLLIDWLSSFPPRQRSKAIRDALLRYLAASPGSGGSPWQEDPDLAAALDALF